ncbi:hypothetical protein L6R49_28995 [Myxococcota bacterium]|nr:hypothetical protein [Myxococcota bacterium]
MSPLSLVLLFFVACAPAPIPDRHAETARACALPSPFVRESADPGALPPIDDLCVEHLAYDLKIHEDVRRSAWAPWVFESLVQLLGRPAGALTEGAALRAPLIETLADVKARGGGDEVGARLYNLTADLIQEVRLDDGALRVETRGGWRRLDTPPAAGAIDGPSGAGSWVHLAAHDLGPDHVPCPEDGREACDAGWDGALGAEVGALELWSRACDAESEPGSCALLREARDRQMLWILSP